MHDSSGVIIKRMWPGGPLRQFSDKPFKGSIPVVGGHGGAYICDVYNHVTPLEGEDGGVRNHDGRWVCVPCGERHEQDKRREAHRKARLFRKTLKNWPNSQVFLQLSHAQPSDGPRPQTN